MTAGRRAGGPEGTSAGRQAGVPADRAGTGARLLGPAEVRRLADRLGIRPAKRLGQNFVIDPGTIRRIVALAGLDQGDVVLEVGPGLGSLTLGLLEAARRVIAVEVDPALAAELPATARDRAPGLAGRLEVVTADALTLPAGLWPARGDPGGSSPRGQHSVSAGLWPARGDPGGSSPRGQHSVSPLPGEPPVALVANLPYNVAVPVLLHLLDAVPSIGRALVMVQAEVADRMCAAPGSRVYGVPSVKLAWFGAAHRAGTISRSVFWPVPNVDSALVAFTRWPHWLEDAWPAGPAGRELVSREDVFAVVDAAFAQRRKTLRSALASWAGSAQSAEAILRAAGIDPALRGEAIGVAQYIRIAAAGGQARTIIES